MLSWRLCFSLMCLFFLSVSSISNVFVRLNSLLYFFPCFSIVVTFLIIVLQGTEPKQGATAAVDASAWTTAQHFPHSALPPEREGHAAPRRRPGWIKHCRLLRLMNGAPSRARVCVMALKVCVSMYTPHTGCMVCDPRPLAELSSSSCRLPTSSKSWLSTWGDSPDYVE